MALAWPSRTTAPYLEFMISQRANKNVKFRDGSGSQARSEEVKVKRRWVVRKGKGRKRQEGKRMKQNR